MQTFATTFRSWELLEAYLNNLPTSYTSLLVQIFSGILDIELLQKLQKRIRTKFTDATIIGATTDGEIYEERVTQQEIVITFTFFEKSRAKGFFFAKDEVESFVKEVEGEDLKVLILFAEAFEEGHEAVIERLKEALPRVAIVGGLAGDNARFEKTMVMCDDLIFDRGIVAAAIYSEDLAVERGFLFNWQPITKEMTVTKAKGSVIYELDNKPIKEVYRYYLGDVVADLLPKTGIEFPLIFKQKGRYVARAAVKMQDDGGLLFAGIVRVGERVRIGFGNVERILQEDVRFPTTLRYRPEVFFIYSCMARRRFLGENIDAELKPLARVAPLYGFFTYGEFYDESFLNETMVILGLSEEKVAMSKTGYSQPYITDSLVTQSALAHLVTVVNDELATLNKNLQRIVEKKTKEIEQKAKELEYSYYHDELTGLPNRYMLEKRLGEQRFALGALIDIKNFSLINDLYGEPLGDKVLQRVASILRSLIKSHCELFRVGSDHFVLLNSVDENCNVFKELLDYFDKNNLLIETKENETLEINLSFIGAFVKEVEKDFLIKAEMALRYAKQRGLRRVLYSKELGVEKEIEEELEAIRLVKNAILHDRVIPVFQMIEKDPVGYECLMRIEDENGELIPPSRFLDKIAKTPYYPKLTKIMIKKCCSYFADKPYHFSLNFTYQDIAREDVVRFFIEQVHTHKVQGRVIVELTESEQVGSFEIVKEFVERVRKEGVMVAIDDFGSGYSNFINLTNLEPDYVKIDGSLVRYIDKDKKAKVIVKAIQTFAKELEIYSIAEFVHSVDVKKELQRLHVNGYQGYLIGRPERKIKEM